MSERVIWFTVQWVSFSIDTMFVHRRLLRCDWLDSLAGHANQSMLENNTLWIQYQWVQETMGIWYCTTVQVFFPFDFPSVAYWFKFGYLSTCLFWYLGFQREIMPHVSFASCFSCLEFVVGQFGSSVLELGLFSCQISLQNLNKLFIFGIRLRTRKNDPNFGTQDLMKAKP